MSQVPYNKLLTNLTCFSRTGEYWPSVVFARISRCSVRTITTSCQYSPVRPSRLVSKRFQYYRPCKGDFVLFYTSIKQRGRFEVGTLKEWQCGNVIVSLDLVHVMDRIIIIIQVALLVPPLAFVCT